MVLLPALVSFSFLYSIVSAAGHFPSLPIPFTNGSVNLGDIKISGKDDQNTGVTLPNGKTFKFFDREFRSFFISPNGAIRTKNSQIIRPSDPWRNHIQDNPYDILPFFQDANFLRGCPDCGIYYRFMGSDKGTKDALEKIFAGRALDMHNKGASPQPTKAPDATTAFTPDPERTLIVTWQNAPSYVESGKYKNTFQTVLTSDVEGKKSFAIMSYQKLEYPTIGSFKAGVSFINGKWCELPSHTNRPASKGVAEDPDGLDCQSNVYHIGTYIIDLDGSSCPANNVVPSTCDAHNCRDKSSVEVCTAEVKEVCGTDDVTYTNMCELRKKACETNGKVLFKKEGRCTANVESCAVNNGGCEEICTTGSRNEVICSCNHGNELKPDGKSCMWTDYGYAASQGNAIMFKGDKFVMTEIPGMNYGAEHDFSKNTGFVSNERVVNGVVQYSIKYFNSKGVFDLLTTTDRVNHLMFDPATQGLMFAERSGAVRFLKNVYDPAGRQLSTLANFGAEVTGLKAEPCDRIIFAVVRSQGAIYTIKEGTSGSTAIIQGRNNPRTMAIDYDGNKIHWVETRNGLSVIASANYDGSCIQILSEIGTHQPFSMHYVFGGYFMYSDTQSVASGYALRRVQAAGPPMPSMMHMAIPLYGVGRVFDRSSPKCPSVKTCTPLNPCHVNNGGCENKCIPQGTSNRCECSYGAKLNADGKTCDYTMHLYSGGVNHVAILKDVNTFVAAPLSGTAFAVEHDISRGLMFFTNVNNYGNLQPTINSMDLKFEMKTLYQFPSGHAMQLAVDVNNKDLYFATDQGMIMRMNYLAAPSAPVMVSTSFNVTGMKFEACTNMLYVVSGQLGRITRVNRVSPFTTNIIAQGLNRPRALTMDPMHQRLYYYSDNAIYESNYDGTCKKMIGSIEVPTAMVHAGGALYYYGDTNRGGVYNMGMFNLANSQNSVVSRDKYKNFDVGAFHDRRMNNCTLLTGCTRGDPCKVNNGGCEEICVVNNRNEAVCQCQYGNPVNADGKTCDWRDYGYVASQGIILMFKGEKYIPGREIPGINYGVEHDYSKNNIFFSNERVVNGVVQYSLKYFNFKGIFDIVTIPEKAEHLFFDPSAQDLYYTTSSGSVMKLKNVYGTNIQMESVATFNPTLSGIVGEPCDKILFVTVTSLGSIYALMGPLSRPIIQGRNNPSTIAIDYDKVKLYWVEFKGNGESQIASANYDGSCIQIVANIGSHQPYSLLFAGSQLVYADKKPVASGYALRRVEPGGKPMPVRLHMSIPLHGIGRIFDRRQPRCSVSSTCSTLNSCFVNNGGCENKCIPEGSTNRCECSYGAKLNSDGKTCDYSMHLYSGGVNHVALLKDVNNFITSPLSGTAFAVEHDMAKRLLFFTNLNPLGTQQPTINSMDFRFNYKTLYQFPDSSHAIRLAVDTYLKELYFATDAGMVMKMSYANPSVPSAPVGVYSSANITALKFESCTKMIYVVSGRFGSIVRVNPVSPITTNVIAAGLNHPRALTMDPVLQRLYYFSDNALYESNYDGTCSKMIGSIEVPAAMVYAGGMLYFYGDTRRAGRFTMGMFSLRDSRTTVISSETYKNFDVGSFYDRSLKNCTLLTGCDRGNLEPCKVNNGGCEDICTENARKEAVCSCRFNRPLKADGKSCSYEGNTIIGGTYFVMLMKGPFTEIIMVDGMNYALAQDFANNYVFVSNSLPSAGGMQTSIKFYNASGDIHTLVSTATQVNHMFYSPMKKELYFAETNAIKKVEDVYDNNRKVVNVASVVGVTGLAGEPCDSRLFVVSGSAGLIYSMKEPIDGSDYVPIVRNRLRPRSLAVDYNKHKIYWVEIQNGLQVIGESNYDGSCLQVIANIGNQQPLSMVFHDGSLMYTDATMVSSGYPVRKLTPHGKPEPIMTHLSSPAYGINQIEKYNTSKCPSALTCAPFNPCSVNNGGCENTCIFSAGSTRCACSYGATLNTDGVTCNYEKHIYYGGLYSIVIADERNSVYTALSGTVLALEHDMRNRTIYFTNLPVGFGVQSTINSMDFKFQYRTLYKFPSGHATHLAIDENNAELYFADNEGNVKKFSNIHTTAMFTPMQVANFRNVTGMKFESCTNMLYVVDGPSGTISRIDRTPPYMSTVIHRGLTMPRALTLDTSRQKLYWYSDYAIQESNYDGTCRKRIVGIEVPTAMVFIQGEIYYNSDTKRNGQYFMGKHTIGFYTSEVSRSPTKNFDIGVFSDRSKKDCTLITGCDGEVDPCTINNGGCEDICKTDARNQVICSCKDGKPLKPDQKSCDWSNYTVVGSNYMVLLIKGETTTVLQIPGRTIAFAHDYKKNSLFMSNSIEENGVFRHTIKYQHSRGISDLTSTSSRVNHMYYSPMTEELLFTQEAGQVHEIVDIYGTPKVSVVTGSPFNASGIVGEPCEGRIFVVSRREGIIYSMKEESIVQIIRGRNQPRTIALDHNNHKIYWVETQASMAVIAEANYDGSCIQIVANIGMHKPFAMIFMKGMLAYTDTEMVGGGYPLRRVIPRGRSLDLALHLNSPIYGLAHLQEAPDKSRCPAANTCVPVSSNPCFVRNGGCEDTCIPVGSSFRCACSFGARLNPDGRTCNYAEFLYYSGVYHLILAKDPKEFAIAPISGTSYAMEHDVSRRTIFFTNYVAYGRPSYLNSMDFSFGYKTLYTFPPPNYPTHLAIDVRNECLYVSCSCGALNKFSNIYNGSELSPPTRIGTFRNVTGMKFVPCTNMLFVIDGEAGTITAMDVRTSAYSSKVIARGLRQPKALTFDYNRHKLHWYSDDEVHESNYDGSCRKVVMPLEEPCAMVFAEGLLYYNSQHKRMDGMYTTMSIEVGSRKQELLSTSKTKNYDIGIIMDRRMVNCSMDMNKCEETGCGADNGGCEDVCYVDKNMQKRCKCTFGMLTRDQKRCDYSNYIFATSPNMLSFIRSNEDRRMKEEGMFMEIKEKNTTGKITAINHVFKSGAFFMALRYKNGTSVIGYKGRRGDMRVVHRVRGMVGGLAYDHHIQALYYSEEYAGVFKINRVMERGPKRPERLLSGEEAAQPSQIVLEFCSRTMFVLDNEDTGLSKIVRAVEGSVRPKIIAFTTGSNRIHGLTIDRQNSKLYWFVSLTGSLVESSFDGKCTRTLTTIYENIKQMSFRDDHLYYLVHTMQGGSVIKKLNPRSLNITTLMEVRHKIGLMGSYEERTPRDCPGPRQCDRTETVFLYPYGREVKDQYIARGNDYGYLYFEKGIPFFSRLKQKIFINMNGHITADQPESNFKLRFPTKFPVLGAYMLPLTTEYGGNVFFRATTDHAILKRAASEAALSKEVPRGYMPMIAIIVTWSDVSVKFNREKKITFQVVYTSDYTDAVVETLYERVDLEGAIYGRSEGPCYHFMAEESFRKSSSYVANISNVGIPGMHVSRVNVKQCSLRKEIHDVDIGFEFKAASGYGMVQPFFFNGSAAHKAACTFTQVMSWNYTSVSFTTYVNYYLNELQLKYIYLIHAPHNTMWGVLTMVVRDSLKDSPMIQKGRIHLKPFMSGQYCHTHFFKMMMDDTPVVKLGMMIEYRAFDTMSSYANIWLRNVSRSGFTFCYKELVAFSGPRKMSVDYIAATPGNKQFHEIGVQPFTGSTKDYMDSNGQMSKKHDNLCQIVHYKYRYRVAPAIFVTPEQSLGSSGVLVAWVKSTYKDYGIICAQNPVDPMDARKTNFKVHYMVQGQMDACSNFTCPENQQCHVDDKGRPSCGCAKTCEGAEPFEFCATNLNTYYSKCEMMKEVCEMEMMHMRMNRTTKVNVSMAYEGRCRHYAYQTGKVQLEAQHNMSVTFCKHVHVDPTIFHASYPLHVLLTVVWNQNMGKENMVHDATASWTEMVSAKGFKACVMLAGRHFFQRIPPPSVHWVAYQKSVASDTKDMEVGAIHMKTWYSGSRCAPIMLKKYSRMTKVLVSVEHTMPNKMIDAMTVWVEKTYFADNMGSMFKVCARELQNFDGMHKGIKINWMAIHEPLESYIIELRELRFPRMRFDRDQPVPTTCMTTTINYNFPSLEDPTVIITAVNMSLTGGMAKSPFSPHDIASWLESNNNTHMTVCYKSLRAGMNREVVRVQYVILPKLCKGNMKFFRGKCFGAAKSQATYAEAKDSHCPGLNASLASASSPPKSYFMATQYSGNKLMWAGYSSTNGKWMSPHMHAMMYTNWDVGQPSTSAPNTCAAINPRNHKWEVVPCSVPSSYVCEKDAMLKERGCSCMNGGVCMVKDGTIYCECPPGFEGYMCEFKISSAMECQKYMLRKEPERSFVNMKAKAATRDPKCPSLVDYRWHRFEGMMMVENRCANRENHCGSKYPGWLAGEHPTMDEGPVERDIHFYKDGKCTNNLGRVMIRNCGTFYVYKFSKLPYMCDHGFCLEKYRGLPKNNPRMSEKGAEKGGEKRYGGY